MSSTLSILSDDERPTVRRDRARRSSRTTRARQVRRSTYSISCSRCSPRRRRRGDLVSRIRDLRHTADAGRFRSGKSPASVSSSLSDDECTTVRRDSCSISCRVDPLRRRAYDSSSITNSISCRVDPLGRQAHNGSSITCSISCRVDPLERRAHDSSSITCPTPCLVEPLGRRDGSRKLPIHRKRTVCAHWGRPYGVGA